MKSTFTRKIWQILALACLFFSALPATAQYALQFEKASSQYVTVPHSASLNLTTSFTMEALVNYSGSNSTIVDKGNYDYLWQLNANGNGDKMGFYMFSSNTWVYSTAAVPQNTLTHVAITLSSGTLTFYINGVEAGTASAFTSQDNQPLNIGRQQPTSCQCNQFNGIMDELRIWNVVRTEAEIQANKDGTINAGSAGLVAYYKFNEGSGTTTADATSNGNNGTLVNEPTFVYRSEPASSLPFAQLGDKLVGTDLTGAAGQGKSVDVSADGNTAIIGGPDDDGGRGAIWFYRKNGGNWQLDGSKIAVESFGFGTSVSISADGTTAVIGAPGDDGDMGAAWIFVRTGGAWVQQGNKLSGTEAAGTPYQGQSVSISDDGNRIIVGAPGDHVTGSAWIFTRTGTVWTQFNNRLAIKPAGSKPAEVGYAVAISGDGHTVMVGGRFDADGIGASWIFKDDGPGAAWSMKTKLVGSNPIGKGLQGSTVSLSYDGTTAATGALADDNGVGAVWGFTFNGTTWAQYGEKTIIPGGEQQFLGWSVALSGDGNTLLAGAPFKPSGETSPGAAYTFHKNADFHLGWDLPKSTIVGTAGLGVSSQGYAVSLSADGNTAVIGGPSDDTSIGATWVFARSGNEWIQQGQKLIGPGAISPTQQGQSVAISADGNTAVVGGPYYDRSKGAIWIYTRSGSAWVQLQQLSVTPFNRSSLGASVAISADGNTIFVGGSTDDNTKGAVWVFTRSGGVFSQQAKLVAGNASNDGYQGSSVACSASGDMVIFGAPADNLGTGAAFVYNRTGSTWSQTTKLLGANSFSEGQEMGSSVGVSADGNTVIAGAKNARNSSFGDLPTGAAYIFTLSGGSWIQQGRLTGPATAALFGWAAAISGDGNTAAVGAPEFNRNQGSTWIFTRSDGNWSQQTILLPTGKIGESKTGSSLALTESGDRLLIGGPQDNNDAGATWVFDRSGTTWVQTGRLFGTGAIGSAKQGTSVAISSNGEFSIVGGIGDNREYGAAWTYATQKNCEYPSTSLYVNAAANGAENGNSWTDAFKTLQSALTAASNCTGITNIWVAKGKYYPDEGGSFADNDRRASFGIIKDVSIYGGFAGNEPSDYNLASRDFTTNETILTGDIDKNDGANFADNDGNAYHVINENQNYSYSESNTVLDGLTVTAGNANWQAGGEFGGGGMVLRGNPSVANCKWIGNAAINGGGIYYIGQTTLNINNSTFSGNKSTDSGGGLSADGNVIIDNSFFTENSAEGNGGAIYSSKTLTITNSKINGNYSYYGGGAVIEFTGNLTMTNCEVKDNSSELHGGGIYLESSPNSVLTNCLITGNSSVQKIGGIYNSAVYDEDMLTLINCTVANNTSAPGYAAIFNFQSSEYGDYHVTTKLQNTLVASNPGGNFGKKGNNISTLSLGNNLDSDGSSGFTNGTNGDLVSVDPLFASDFRLQTCSPAVNAGNNAATSTTTDVSGYSRKFGIIDIGAYELQQAFTNPTLPGGALQIVQTVVANQTSAFTESCGLVAKLQSSGTSPVAGSVEARLWVETMQPSYHDQPYVKRHYQITPDDAIASTATGTVTLYFTQADFNSFNGDPGAASLLPTGPDDATGISHFAIYKFSGRSGDETGLPGSYLSTAVQLAAPNVQLTWNEASQWWEATFTVTGFSGFFAGSTSNPLPISDLLDFTVSKNGESGAAIKWQVLPDHKIASFELEKSYNGRSFTTFQSVPVKAGVLYYAVNDSLLQFGTQYYRLKLFDIDGSVSHSRIKSFQWNEIQLTEAYPNPFSNTLKFSLRAVDAGDLKVSLINVSGQTIVQQAFGLSAGPNTLSINIGNLSSGVYLLRYSSGGTSGYLRVVKN
jgi:predicted outer membrane repeat protein